MAEAFVQVILDNLSSLIKEEIGVILHVDEEMKKLCSTLTTIQAVLEDAEDKQIESPPIRNWLRKLNALAYEIDDILDDCNTHVSKSKHFATTLSRYSIKKIMNRHKIGRRMKEVTQKLDSVAAERAKFHLREISVDKPREAAAWRETGSMLNDCDLIYGRDADRDEIVKVLVEDLKEKSELSVLPVMGVGGLGKTTLAQLVFNDPRVVEHFEKRVWICVSENFEIKTLVKAMIESATGSGRADLQHLDALQRCLWEVLSQKRYLVVLDDVWNDDQHKWFELKDILSCGSSGASIIVTTRLKKVADIMGTLPAHCLKGISDEHCWMLFKQRAFGQEEEDMYPKLKEIGKEIAKRCVGVPLAAKALGGILRFKRREEEWKYVRESEIWKLSPEESLIMPALRLSYHHLPLELRQCFAYFAAFPKDCEVDKKNLILLWMAHGFISSKGTLEAEEVGNEICNELVLRSLLEPTNYNKNLLSMHDLVHDLAQSVMENKVPGVPQIQQNLTSSAPTIREVHLQMKYVLFPKIFQQDMDISSIMEHTSLRVLDASGSYIKELPPSVCNLKHLTHLNLSGCEILRFLPNSLCSLWNLQILNLNNCFKLVALPKNTRYLRNLQHLCLSSCDSLSEMPYKFGELSCLKTLSKFVVGFHKDNQVEELQCLDLIGELQIEHLERVKDHMNVRKANLVEKKNLKYLSLSWKGNSLSKLGEDVAEKVLEALEPHPNLESLCIIGFTGRHFPLWMTLGNIIKMEIRNCRNCRCLPKLGELPHLESLVLENLGVEYIIEDEEVGSGNPLKIQFPALESLRLSNLPNVKGLSKKEESKESFPNLEKLTIRRCSSLMLPPHSSFNKLKDLECSSSNLTSFHGVDVVTRLEVAIEEADTKCFPIETLVKFTNLEVLTIRGANEISVVGDGLQALKQLKYLRIYGRMRCIPEGLFRQLSSLQTLGICECPELVELPEEEIKHLKNLESLYLDGLRKMARLPQALQNLSSLKALDVRDCPEVVSIPAAIPNLKQLLVFGCPQLKRRCQKETGEDWHKIAHIPHLLIP